MDKNRVREIRKLRKMTLEELADKLNMSYSAVQKLDAGTVDLDTQWMRKLSAVLNVKPYELLPLDMQPEEITPEEREILRMIRKTAVPQTKNSPDVSAPADSAEHSAQPAQPPHKSNER